MSKHRSIWVYAAAFAAGAAAANLGFIPLNPRNKLTDLSNASIARSSFGLDAAAFASHSALTGGASTLPNVIEQSGYYAPGDGGDVTYDWNAMSTATADGGTIMLPSGQSRATAGRYVLRIPPGSGVSPLLYGAKGDDTTDDTAAVQAALTGAVTAGVPLFFDCNHLYKVSGSLTSSGKAIIKGCPPVGNDGLGNAQNCLSGIDASGLNNNLFVLSGPSGRMEDMCLQMAPPGSQATAGAAVLLGGADMQSFGLAHNTIFRPYDGISFGGGTAPNNLVRNSWARDNTIRSPARYGIAVGLGTTGGATAGITIENNVIGCDTFDSSGIGFAFFDGAVKWDGTTVGPNNCYINSEIVPGAGQNVNGEFKGVMGDSAGTHGGGSSPMELYIEPQNSRGAIEWLSFVDVWAAGVEPGDTPVYINNRNGGACSNIKFVGLTAHSGVNSGTANSIVYLGGCANISITGSMIDAWPGAKTAAGIKIDGQGGSTNQPSHVVITGNHIGVEAGATLTDGILITSNGLNPQYLTVSGNELEEAQTPINVVTEANNQLWTFGNNIGVDDLCPSVASANTLTIPGAAACIHVTGRTTIQNIIPSWANRKVTLIADNGLSLRTGGSTLGVCASNLTVPAAGAAYLQFNTNNACWTHQ